MTKAQWFNGLHTAWGQAAPDCHIKIYTHITFIIQIRKHGEDTCREGKEDLALDFHKGPEPLSLLFFFLEQTGMQTAWPQPPQRANEGITLHNQADIPLMATFISQLTGRVKGSPSCYKCSHVADDLESKWIELQKNEVRPFTFHLLEGQRVHFSKHPSSVAVSYDHKILLISRQLVS